MQRLAEDHGIVFLTGRPGWSQAATENWLEANHRRAPVGDAPPTIDGSGAGSSWSSSGSSPKDASSTSSSATIRRSSPHCARPGTRCSPPTGSAATRRRSRPLSRPKKSLTRPDGVSLARCASPLPPALGPSPRKRRRVRTRRPDAPRGPPSRRPVPRAGRRRRRPGQDPRARCARRSALIPSLARRMQNSLPSGTHDFVTSSLWAQGRPASPISSPPPLQRPSLPGLRQPVILPRVRRRLNLGVVLSSAESRSFSPLAAQAEWRGSDPVSLVLLGVPGALPRQRALHPMRNSKLRPRPARSSTIASQDFLPLSHAPP